MKETDTQNIIHDSFDHSKFTKMFYGSELGTNLSTHAGEYSQYPELTQDMFYSMYKYAPQFSDQNAVNQNYHLNRNLIQKSMETQAYSQLRAYTRLNDVSASIAAATLTENIVQENADIINQMKKQQKQINEQRKILKKINDEFKNMGQQQQTYQNQQIRQHLKERMGEIMEQINSLKQQQQQAGEGMSIMGAMQNTLDSINAQEEMMESMGRGSGGGSLQRTTIEDRMKFSKLFLSNKKFQKLVKLLGRMKRLAEKKQKQKTKNSIETIADIITSNRIESVLSSELLYLTDPDLQILFDKKFIESELLTYEFEGNEEKGKGPIITCLDISGSMSGSRDAIAKAVALALVMIAHKQKRDAVIILFDHGVRKTYEFPKREKKDDGDYWTRLSDLARYFTGGGTDFTGPLEKSMKYLALDEKYKKADLIWITDGDGNLSERVKYEFLDLKQEKKINCYSIIIDGSYNLVDHALKDISNTLTAVNELTDDVAADLFEAI